MTHDELRELIAAYTLDALTPGEVREVEAHLPMCEECRHDLRLMREVAGDLAAGVRMVQPSAVLRARILDAIAFPRRARVWTLGVAALAVVLAGVSLSLNQRLTALTERLAAHEQVLALLASPSAKTAALSGSVQANVRFVYDPARRQGALVVSDLRDPGAEFVYQLWLVAGQEPQSAGVFRPVPGRPIIVPVAADFSRYQVVAISVERGPQGAPRPTSTPVLAASI